MIKIHATCTDPIAYIISSRTVDQKKAHMEFYGAHQRREVETQISALMTLGLRKLQAHEALLPGTFSLGVVQNHTGVF